jgi:predicted O-methyltransferase YrrM
MDISKEIFDFVNRIKFPLADPMDSGIALISSQIPTTIDLEKTTLPTQDQLIKNRLRGICRKVRRMSTFAVGAIINLIVTMMPDNLSYVNVGVWNGFSLLSGMAGNPNKKCIGIDNFSQFGSPKSEFLLNFDKEKSNKHLFYEMDYVDYFNEKHTDEIGFYFYDGQHSRENQFKGLKIAEPYLAKGGIIMVDDVNVKKVLDGTNDFLRDSRYKYNLVVQKNTSHNCHPTFWNGILLMRRAS